MDWHWYVDGWMVVAGSLCAMACALVGNFLVLRRLSLIGDAISHAVLPGIAAAFLWTGSRSTWSAVIGAVVVGIVTVWLTEFIRRYGRVEESAAIGVVFTALFALGLMMVARADNVDLDPSCVLYGNLETIVLDNVSTPLGNIPRVALELGCIFLLNLALVLVFYREWSLSTFDPGLALAQGISVTFFHYLLAAMVAVTCIVAFRAVGNILVIAMLIVPSSIAFLCCSRLRHMVPFSLISAIAVAVLGHLAAIWVPPWFGFKSANSAAMMAVASGLLLVAAVIFSPKGGLWVKSIARQRLAYRILSEDILAILYRQSESLAADSLRASDATLRASDAKGMSHAQIAIKLHSSSSKIAFALRDLIQRGYLAGRDEAYTLTEEGLRYAQNLIRSHRQWEQYLSLEAGVSDPRLHLQAESFEHYTDSKMREELDRVIGAAPTDPHGKHIPPESS
jgi:manganese/zinc/iron transport system permease protein